ncbi:hypothetical protein BST11_02165 [Mycobacterium alsense]|uniref:Uncharacterized protein n=1 Tax=Mycobacterium alsense TaxID=324058 RepID=A0ABX3RJ54_9MYCO|nr:hypothetical protein [Mycobacterium alsense]OQZ93452.1 hypothetical protein BST11_02165 [Mycobacterium alsense]
MPVPRKTISFGQQIAIDREGNPYDYGGNWDPFNRRKGTDCSGCVVDELDGGINGTAMEWSRHGLCTESWRAPSHGGQANPFDGPFHTIQVANPSAFPADAAIRIALHHGPGGGMNSHMWCQIGDLRVETNGDNGTVLRDQAMAVDNPYANDWWFVPGPIVEDGTPIPHQPSGNGPAPEGEPRDTLFADVSEHQVPVTDAYTDATYHQDDADWHYRWLSIRANDGTHRDNNFAQNYGWCKQAADSGRLNGFIVYAYWRPDWQATLATFQDQINSNGGPHPKMVAMIDVECGDGNPNCDQSAAVNGMYYALAKWLGDARRVIGYCNLNDMRQMWQTRPEHVPMIVAGYGSNPNDPNVFKVAHQYTDGQGYGGGLPEGVPPFGNCDMNSADGLSPSQLASVLGVGDAVAVTPSPLVVPTVPADYQRLIYEQLAGPVGSDGYGHGWPQLGNLTVVDYLAKYKPALDVLLAQAPRPAKKKTAPRIVIPAAGNGAASRPATAAKRAPARKAPAKKP